MGILGKIVVCIIIAIVGFSLAQYFWLFLRYFNFDVPFTKKMVSLGVISPKNKMQLLFSSFFGITISTLIGVTLCLAGAYFARPAGFYVCITAFILSLLFIRPTKDRYTWSQYNIEHYISKYNICMDIEKIDSLL